ncbi:MAG: VOC family protein [Nitrospirales bacterium]|nr:VOC family protein [Nitrospirales bacterium]
MTNLTTKIDVPALDLFGSDATFHHIGLAVVSIRKAVPGDVTIVTDETQRVSVAFIELNGISIELIEPFGEKSPVSASLTQGQRLVHLCFSVSDIEAAIVQARKHDVHCIAKPVPATAFGNRKIAWLFSRTYGTIELVEREMS